MVNAKVSQVRSDPTRQARNFSHTRHEHSREIIQDYVEAIARLIAETGEARVVDLAKRLGVTHVTVNRTIGRLQKTGYVRSEPYRAIFLTDKGRQLAAACKARHETVVAFLRFLGIPDRVAEMDAEGIEHHVSPQTLTAFRAALRNAGRSKRAAESGKGERARVTTRTGDG
jgi:DtxR family manganese transport transcriptional regulator